MTYDELFKILKETKLSPEKLGPKLGISNMTYRRWLSAPKNSEIPKKYEQSTTEGIYQLILEGALNAESKIVQDFLKGHLPTFFNVAMKNLDLSVADLYENNDHEEKVSTGLAKIGAFESKQKVVHSSLKKIISFQKFGIQWKSRIKSLLKVIQSKDMSTMDKLVAYGGLFYLVTPFDLIPDCLPVFGYIDDFAILGFAIAYYLKRWPKFVTTD